MALNCPRCKSVDARRSRQAGAKDRLLVLFKRWPYRCNDCNHRFTYNLENAPPARVRPHIPIAQAAAPMTLAAAATASAAKPPTSNNGPAVGFQAAPNGASAQITIHAESPAHLDQLLFTLGQAVSSYDKASRPGGPPTPTPRSPMPRQDWR